jgi:hypothetical protein
VEHLANPMVLTGAWVAQVMTEEQMKLHEGSPHVKAIHLGHTGDSLFFSYLGSHFVVFVLDSGVAPLAGYALASVLCRHGSS